MMKGEALGLRAFLHFDLLRLYGPVYSVTPTGKAIPYRTSFDQKATPVLLEPPAGGDEGRGLQL